MNGRKAAALVLLMVLLIPGGLLAAPVGQVLQVEGEADLSRGGKPPAVPLTLATPVETGDVVRTKSTGRVQIKFVDDSVLTIAPESRVAIEAYMFDAAKGERQAVLEVFRGLVHTTVPKVFPGRDPDFTVKTHTAIMGVRGTRWYAKLLPEATEVYTEGSLLEVRCRKLPEKLALLKNLQFTRVGWDSVLPAVNITQEVLDALKLQLKTGIRGEQQKEGATPFQLKVAQAALQQVSQQLVSQMTPVERITTSGFYVPPQPPPPSGLLSVPFFILLTWGTGAQDLDLHLAFPDNQHVYFSNTGSSTTYPYAQYFRDCTLPGGSEVIQVTKYLIPTSIPPNGGALYKVFVNDFTSWATTPDQGYSSTVLSGSSRAVVQLIRGGTVTDRTVTYGESTQLASTVTGGQVIATFSVTNTGAGNTWSVVDIDAKTQKYKAINKIVNFPNPSVIR